MATAMNKTKEDFDDPTRTVGADATASFDDGPSNPTEHASSEALGIPAEDENEDSAVMPDHQAEPESLQDQSELDGEDLLHEDEEPMPGDEQSGK